MSSLRSDRFAIRDQGSKKGGLGALARRLALADRKSARGWGLGIGRGATASRAKIVNRQTRIYSVEERPLRERKSTFANLK